MFLSAAGQECVELGNCKNRALLTQDPKSFLHNSNAKLDTSTHTSFNPTWHIALDNILATIILFDTTVIVAATMLPDYP